MDDAADELTDPRTPGGRPMVGKTMQVIALAVCAATATACAAKSRASSAEDTAATKHYEIAVGSFHNGMFDDAKVQIEMALASDPEHADSYYLLGLLRLQEGKTMVDAIEIQRCLTDQAATHQRERAEASHELAHEAFAKAAEFYEKDEAGRGRAYNSMAVVSLFFHDHERAIEEAQEALRSQFYGERYSALANLGWAYYGKGDLVEAMTELRQSVLLNPDYCVGRYRLAQVYLEYGTPEQALEESERLVTNDTCPIQDAHRIAGVARIRMGDPAAAKEAFQSCVALAPRSCLATDCQRFLQAPAAETLAP